MASSPNEINIGGNDPAEDDLNSEKTGRDEDSLINHLEICVSEAEKRANGALNIRDFYTVYLIETKVTNPEWACKLISISSVWRRYTEFEQLRSYLECTYPYIVLPPLPEKKVLYGWQKVTSDTFDPDFVDRRRAGLENFLLRVASHLVLSQDQHFVEFLQQEEYWKDSIRSAGYMQLAENKLKSLTVAVRLKNPDPRFETFKAYSNSLQNNLSKFLRIRARLVEHEYNIYKLHAGYGRIFSEWSVIETEMGDGLQKAGHYLDSLSSSIDSALEDEELYADQLKEYLFYASALEAVCKRQEILQLHLESSENSVANKNLERSKTQQGKSSLMSRLFGAVDTDETRELKVNLLDQKIREEQRVAKSAKEELADFTTLAVSDIERFMQQKDRDLKETLMAYSVLQLKTAKKSLQTWIHIRDCLQSIP